MRRTTSFLILSLFLAGAAATPAFAKGRKAGHGQRIDSRTRLELAKVFADRDSELRKLDRTFESEKRRARRKSGGDRARLRRDLARLDGWYERSRAAIERKFVARRDIVRAKSRPNGRERDLAVIRAKRDTEIRRIDADLADEIRRAKRKYAYKPDLRAAFRRLDVWAGNRREKVRRQFRERRAHILAKYA